MIQYKIINFENSSGIAATIKESKKDFKKGVWNKCPSDIIGMSISKVIIIDINPPKKHLANKLIGSLFLSFLNIKQRKINTGVIDAINKVIDLVFEKWKNTNKKWKNKEKINWLILHQIH